MRTILTGAAALAAAAWLAGVAGAGIGVTPNGQSCHGAVISVLATYGYTPAFFANANPQLSSGGDYSKSVAAGCQNNLMPAQVGADELAGADVPAVQTAAVLLDGFGIVDPMLAAKLLGNIYGPADVAEALAKVYGVGGGVTHA